mmetsp:Transcript_14797/g.14897  ORF Transcript_14797/g.14897 Transcript_14797/m.14897 type:complete len:329 (-) Transcript_14797:93-1079(-)
MPHLVPAEMAKKFGPALNMSSLRSKKLSQRGTDKNLMESKKGRLEDLLIQQYLAKYGVKKESSSINNAIGLAVHNFIKEAEDLQDVSHAATSGELDAIVRNAAAKAKSSGAKSKPSQSLNNNTNSVIQSTTNELSQKQRQDLMLPLQKQEEPEINKIAVLSTMERLAEEKKKQKELQDRIENQRKFKESLDSQARERETRLERERKEKEKILQQTVMSTKKFEDEIENAKVQKLKSFEIERHIRQKQLEERQLQRVQERERKIAEERYEMERAARLMEEEEQMKRERKEQQKVMNEVALHENEKIRARKMEELNKQRDIEYKTMKEYA